MARNSFKRLEEEESGRYPGPPQRIKSNVQSNIGILKLVGQIIEVYLPKVFEFFVMVSGGDASKINKDLNERQGSGRFEAFEDQNDPTSLDDSAPPMGPSNPDITH